MRRRVRRQRAIRILSQALVWLGVAVIYYIGFSLFFDTPAEYQLKHSTDTLREQYDMLSARYDSLEIVLDNVVARDRNVFNILFESTPYELDAEFETERLALQEKMLTKSNRELSTILAAEINSLELKLS